ncbi:MAG TPA: NEW3 domain-containing protein [Lysobacter sp.]
MHVSRAFRHAGRSIAALLLLSAVFGAPVGASPAATTGKPVALEGELDVLVEDYADGHSRTRHYLKTSRGRVELKFSRKPTTLPSGTKVRVRGQAQGDVLALDGAIAGSVETLAAALPYTMGEQRVAVIMVNFQDDTTQPRTVADMSNVVFNTVSNFYREASFGQTWFSGQAFGYYTIAMSKSVCDPYTLASLADQKATAAGVNLSAFNRKLYVFPKTACTWAGLGNVGGSSTKAWANGSFSNLVVAHEIGHNYGLQHAQSLNCDVSALGNTCTTITYGDTADTMGNYRAAHFNPFEKELLGWLNDGVSPPIHTASTSGRYAIEPYSSSSVGAKAIKIPRGTDSSGKKLWYYVEYRQPIGADAVLATTGNMTQGVIVRTATETDTTSSRQLDMTPNTSTTSYYTELADGALAVGRSYNDATAKVTITLVSTSTTSAIVDVIVGAAAPAPTCTRAAPTLSLSGPTTAVAAGSTVNYTVTLTNKDSSACAATSFSLAKSVPSGWTGTLAASSVSLSPGASTSTTLSVASAGTASAGSYGIGVGASSSIGSAHTANASATYSVAAQSTGTLTETLRTDSTSYVRGQTVFMSARVFRNGVALSGASVRFNIIQPGGSVLVLTATTDVDGYARNNFKLGKGKAAIGNYTLRADATSGTSTTTMSTGFSVL